MPRKKKTETTPVTEVKAEVTAETVNETPAETPAEAVKETVAEVVEPTAEKSAKKPAAKKAPAKKPAAKTKTAAKTADKAVKAAKTAAAPKETVKVQFGSDEYDLAEIRNAVEADYKSKFKGRVKSVEIYVKPEDKAAYYVVNADFSDKIDL